MPAFSVRQSKQIKIPIAEVYASVRDFKQWPKWSPWLVSEPDCALEYAKDGKSYSWEGKVIGAGGMEITRESEPNSIDYRLIFLKPWKSEADVKFAFAEKDGGTEVTWSMDSSLPIFIFFMKKMMVAFIGSDYERGLSMLKDHLETGSVLSKLDLVGREQYKGVHYVGIETACATNDISSAMEKDMKRLGEWIGESKVTPAGPPFSIYRKWDLVKGLAEYTVGFPIHAQSSQLPADLVAGKIPPCEVYKIKHTGSYRHLGNAWTTGHALSRAKVFAFNKKIDAFEIYENDPHVTAEGELVTLLHFPVR